MKTTFKKLQDFNNVIGELYAIDSDLKNTKFGYAVRRFSDTSVAPAFKKYHNELELIRVDYALTDPKTKEILIDEKSPRGYKYNKEDFKKVVKAEQDLEDKYLEMEFDIEPFMAKDVPEMNESQREALEGFVVEGKIKTKTK